MTIFDGFDNIVNSSTLQALEVDLIDDPALGNILARASTTDFEAEVTVADWRSGIDQQALLLLGQNVLSAIDMDGQPTLQVWMVFHASTLDAAHIILASGWVTLRAGVPGTVQLPLYPPPLIIPKGTTYTIPPGVTVTFPSSPTVLGSLVLSPAQGNIPAGQMVIAQP